MAECDQCIVKSFNAFKSIKKTDLMHLSGCKTSRFVKKGETLFEEDEVLNGVYCIRKGICKLSKLSVNGKDQIIKLVVKGDLLGQRSLISNEASNLSAVALNDMEVCFVPKNEIMHGLNNNPKFSLDMLQQMANDLKLADNVIIDMAQKPVKQRLAELLLYIKTDFGLTEDGYLKIVLSREDYANLGTATESAIRIISQFKKDKLISTSGKQIKIEDKDGLSRVH